MSRLKSSLSFRRRARTLDRWQRASSNRREVRRMKRGRLIVMSRATNFYHNRGDRQVGHSWLVVGWVSFETDRSRALVGLAELDAPTADVQSMRRIDARGGTIYSAEFTFCWRKLSVDGHRCCDASGSKDLVRRSGATLVGAAAGDGARLWRIHCLCDVSRAYQTRLSVRSRLPKRTVDPESAYFLSPFYSPLLALPSWVPAWIAPAIFVMWMPAGFRLTCYYGRKAYYRAFFLRSAGVRGG